MAQVSYGTITITDTNDINRIYVEYCRSTSNQLSGTTVPNITRAWGETTPQWVDGQYIWQRAVIEQSGTLEKTYGTPVCITGAQGETGGQGPQGPQGGTGAAGRSLTSTTTQYTTAATNATITQNNMSSYTWSSNVPTYNASTPAYWVRITNVYSNPSSTEYIIYKDNGITDAVKTSNDANTIAGQAKTQAETAEGKANNAVSTAGEAKTIAEGASSGVTALQTRTKYFWTNLVAHTNGSSGWTKPNYPVGTYAASGISGTTFDEENSSTYGYNTLYSNGIKLRYNAINLGELTGTSLVFYRPSTTVQGSKGMELTSTTLKFYDATGAVAQATFGGTQATISGTINAYDGKIGNDTNNYWYIGNYTDYNQNDSAIIKSKGTASIQLDETNTWRISTNRIHTAWAPETGTDAFKLHFPKFNDSGSVSKYWDYGLHLPVSYTDKFFYIRNASGSETLDNLLNDLDDNGYNYWNYLFWVDASGNVHAPGFYIGNSTTPIGGGAGTVAERLTQGYGSATQPIYFNSNGTPTNTTYTLNAAGAKGVDTSIAAASTSTNLPTSKAVAAFVEGKGYITSYTDYRVKTEARGSTTMYLAGSNTSGTVSQGTLLTDSGVYVQTSSSSTNLVVPKVNGYTLAAASAKGVDTSIAAASTSTNLPTSKAVAAFVEGKGYKTTDNNTTYSLTQDSNDGHKITLTPSSGNAQTVTIPDNNTTYTFANGTNGFTVTPSGGEAQTVTVTPSISNNITGTGTRTSGYLAKFSGTNTITNGPAIGTGTTKFLREDGTWVVPGGTYSLPTASSSILGGVKVGSGLSISDGVLSHTDTSSQASSSNSGRTYIQSITLDTYGHVTALSTATETVTNTHNTAYLYAGKSDGTANAVTTNGNTYLILMDGGSATTRRKISGSGTVSVASDANGNITVTGSAHPTSLKNPNALAIKIYNGNSTPSNTNYDGSTANQSVSVAGTGAITSIGISGSTLSWTKADGTTGSSTVTITASVASGSRILTDADGNALNVGSTNKPVYFSGGVPVTLKDGTNDLTIGKSVPSDAKFTDTWTAMVGATSSTNGSIGYVNAVPPKDGYNTKFLRADGTWVVPGGTYSLPLAANGTRGGVQIGYSANGKNYPVQLSSEKMYVNVPWENTWRGIQDNLTSSTNTTESLSAKQGYLLANGSARDDTKLPLAGGTMTGQIKTSAGSGTWLSAATNAALYSTVTSGYNAIISQATKNGRITIGTYPSSDDKWYLTYFLNTRTENSNDGQLSWTPSTNTLSTNISGNAVTATTASWANLLKPIATTTTASASTWNIPSGSKQVWGERFSDSTLTYTPSGGSATTITDTGDWVMWLTPNATSNAATLNMRIDGTYYGSFSGNLSGNASTATTAISLNGGTALSSKNLNDYHDTSGKLNYYYAGGSNSCTNVPVGNGIQFGMITYNSATGHVTQELSSFSSATNKGKWIRWYQSSTWTDWEKFLTSVNYSDYTVTKTGTGASGTWGISISGSAAKLGTSNVGAADRPIYLSAGSPSQTTYRMAATNATATSALSIDTNLDTGIWYVNGTNSTNLYSVSDGAAYVNKYNDSWIAQIYQDYRTGQIALRGKNNGTWQAWRKVLDSSNYTNYLGSAYVKTTGNEGILGTKVFGSGTSYGTVTNNTTYTEKANINYNSTLEAIVFSFA